MRFFFVLCFAVLAACGSGKSKSPDASVPLAKQAQALTATRPQADEACGQMIVVAWDGAQYAPPSLGRDESLARTRAETLLASVERGDDFAMVAATQSDGERTRARGGLFGTFTREDFPATYAELKEPLFRLHIGQISEIIHTQFGWVILRRCAVEKIRLRHILIRYQGAENAPADLVRTRDAAMAMASALRFQVSQEPTSFETVARARSEDEFATRGGNVGWVGKGRLELTYENFAFALNPGELSPAFETEAGFYIVERLQ